MKKILLAFLLLGLTACGSNPEVASKERNEEYEEVDFDTIKNFFYEKFPP